MTYELKIIAENTDSAAAAAEDLLLYHAIAAGKPFDDEPLSLTAIHTDQPEQPLGYLEGASMQGRFYLTRLAVSNDARGQGIGSALLSKAEQIVTKRGDAEIVLDTWNFQAEGFYAHHGYEVIGRLDDLPQGAGKVWMRKKLPVA